MVGAGFISRAPLLMLMVIALALSACVGSDDGVGPDTNGQRGDAPTATAEITTDATSQSLPATGEPAVTTERDEAAETAVGEPANNNQTEEPSAAAVDLAPALGSIDEWHNSAPLSLDALRGAPVLLVFWSDF